ncbi:GIY-YIG nuclease family protein [Aeromonas caviae]|uniref:GIY-YIG nuclease family protein n=1 Tax=Aeromonas TaxID=642 RepID=UPI0023DB2CFB|nr:MULTISPECIES: GIY-YIG nuclease family protein [Aeromonas]MDF2274629.1 GIY-YIG nuclease family protein [Aeromonas caviae]
MKKEGYIYILRDRRDNNLIKVGYSKNPFKRVKQLYNTSTALPMGFYQIWWVDDMALAEKAAHTCLEGHRINPRREFFEIAPLPDFDDFERTDYETTCVYLDTLIEVIENGFYTLELNYMSVDIDKLYQLYLDQGDLNLE